MSTPESLAAEMRIGLVYADMNDPTLRDPFHQQVCTTFANLAHHHPNEIKALVDPEVTVDRLRQVFNAVDFLFYWGHGSTIHPELPIIYGSTEDEQLGVFEFGHHTTRCKAIYLDGCELGMTLKEQEGVFPTMLISCPDTITSFDTSVRMGCSVMANIFGAGCDVREAFERSAQQPSLRCPYRVVGKGQSFSIAFSPETRGDILHAFLEILLAWNAYQPNLNNTSEEGYTNSYIEAEEGV